MAGRRITRTDLEGTNIVTVMACAKMCHDAPSCQSLREMRGAHTRASCKIHSEFRLKKGHIDSSTCSS
jgi:hypothetical protein